MPFIHYRPDKVIRCIPERPLCFHRRARHGNEVTQNRAGIIINFYFQEISCNGFLLQDQH